MFQSKQAGCSPPSQAPEGLVMCANCPIGFVSSIEFDTNMNGHWDFQMMLFKKTDDQSFFFKTGFAFTEQDDGNQECKVKCPKCENKFWLSIELLKVIDKTQCQIKVSITTRKIENQGDKQSVNKPAVNNSVRKRRRVKVFYKSTGETFGADKDVKKQLKSDKFVQLEETNLGDCYIIIMFCPITSRVGSDVESSMKNATVSSSGKPVILVLMHHTRDPEYSTAGTNWSEVYGNVVLDVDVLFHETQPGLLTCRRNDDAFKIIQNELSKRSKEWA